MRLGVAERSGRSSPASRRCTCGGGRGSRPRRGRRRRTCRTNLRPSARAIEWPSDVLPTPGGPTKQRIWPETSLLELRDREVLDDPVLDLLEVEVVVVEDRARVIEVEVVLGERVPRQRENPLEVGADHAVLGGGRRQPLEPRELPVGRLAHVLGQRRARRGARAARSPRPALGRPRRAPAGSPSAAGAGSTPAGPSPSPTAPATGSS